MKKVAIVRGKFLNGFEMQFFEPLVDRFDITAFGSMKPYHESFAFTVVKLLSPMDLPDMPYKMQILNRLLVDAQYLLGLEDKLDGFDLVHTAETYYHYTQQCLDAKRRGSVKKVIATVLDNIPHNNEGIWGRRSFKKRARVELDHMIALTNRTKAALLLEGADERKITVLGHFIDTKRFKPKKHDTQNSKLEIRILFCGRLEKYKGVYELLYSLRLLLLDPILENQIIRLKMIGNGSERIRLQELEKHLGLTHAVEHCSVLYEDMPAVYQEADIYVAPSKATRTYQEQYNTTLLEAQASGLPIVTTASGGIPENVGDAALIVSPADVFSLKEGMKEFILKRKMRETYGKKARHRAETVHDARIGANKLAALYERVLA